MLARPRFDSDGVDVNFDEGRIIPVSFANWDGSNDEVGSKHTLTTWYWLVLPPEINWVRVIGISFIIALIIFVGGITLIRSQRRKKII